VKKPESFLDVAMAPFWLACDALEWFLDACLAGLDSLANWMLRPTRKKEK